MSFLEVVLAIIAVLIAGSFFAIYRARQAHNAGEKNQQAEAFLSFIQKPLLFASAGLNAYFTYAVFSSAGVLVGVFFGLALAGVNLAEAYAIRWAIVAKRENRILSFMAGVTFTSMIVAYSLVAGSSSFSTLVDRNKQLAHADKLTVQGYEGRSEQQWERYYSMKDKGGYSQSTLDAMKQQAMGAESRAKLNQAQAIKDGTIEVNSMFLFWAIPMVIVTGLLSLALEAAIIGVIVFNEILKPTPLSGVLRFIDQWLAPDVRVEDAVIKNPWGGGDADKIGFIEANVQRRKAQVQADVHEIAQGAPGLKPTTDNVEDLPIRTTAKPATASAQNEAEYSRNGFGFIPTQNHSPTGQSEGVKNQLDPSNLDPLSTLDRSTLEASYKTPLKSNDDSAKLKLLEARGRVSGTAKIGDTIECVNCGKKMLKRAEIHKYCSTNRKPRPDGGNCSNEYNTFMKAHKQKG